MKRNNNENKRHGANPPIKGLPSTKNLRELASTYLTEQEKHFPDLQSLVVMQSADDASLAQQFEECYRSGSYQPFAKNNTPPGTSVGAAYIRYSDDNSNPRSLDQQLNKVLNKAKSSNVFIPWQYVFADAGITATTTERPGYQQLLKLIASDKDCPGQLIVDQLDRLNRDQADSFVLQKFLKSRECQFLSTDGLDSNNEQSKIALTVMALRDEMQIDQLLLKVDRGLVDRFNLGKHVHAPPMGYKLVMDLNANGQPVLRSNGKVEQHVEVDPEAAELINRIFRLYAEQKLSPKKIAQILDKEKALGRSTWGASTISQILKNKKYIGHWAWKQTTKTTDPITGKRRTVRVPEKDHLTREFPERRIIADELWQATRKREQEVARKTNPPKGRRDTSRQEAYPTMLFNLYCEHCDRPLIRYRSGKYAQLACPNGKDGLRGCGLKSSKALRIIEECLLTHVKQQVFTDGFASRLCEKANEFLEEEAKKPTVDTAKLQRDIASLNVKIKRNAKRLADLNDGPAADTLLAQIKNWEAELSQQKTEHGRLERGNARPEVLQEPVIIQHLDSLRELLHGDVVKANAVLAKLMGRVRVSIGEKQGRTFTWNAKVDVNPVAGLVDIARSRDCPTTHSLEFLQVCSWTMDDELPVTIVDFPNYQRIAADAIKMHDAGSPYNRIAVAMEIDPSTVKKAIEWGAKNDVTFIPPADFSVRRELPNNKTRRIAKEVARLRDEEKLKFEEIAEELNTTGNTASRAYKQYHAKANLAAVEKGERLDTGKNNRKISQQTIIQIRKLLTEGKLSKRAIAREVGVTSWTVRHEAKRIEAEGLLPGN